MLFFGADVLADRAGAVEGGGSCDVDACAFDEMPAIGAYADGAVDASILTKVKSSLSSNCACTGRDGFCERSAQASAYQPAYMRYGQKLTAGLA